MTFLHTDRGIDGGFNPDIILDNQIVKYTSNLYRLRALRKEQEVTPGPLPPKKNFCCSYLKINQILLQRRAFFGWEGRCTTFKIELFFLKRSFSTYRVRPSVRDSQVLFVNFSMLELTYRAQTFRDYSFISEVRKRSNSIFVTKTF